LSQSTLPVVYAGRPLPAALGPTEASSDAVEPDLIALAASQARDHAVNSAITAIGPGTVEQLTAEVVRLGRAYLSGSPLPLFTAMHQALGRVEAASGRRAGASVTRPAAGTEPLIAGPARPNHRSQEIGMVSLAARSSASTAPPG
jgi:hypothetical protein